MRTRHRFSFDPRKSPDHYSQNATPFFVLLIDHQHRRQFAAKKYLVAVIGHTGQCNYGHGHDVIWKYLPEQRAELPLKIRTRLLDQA